MPKPHPSRLLPETYPFSATVPTRWSDLDMLRHINNVAMATLFEEGRSRFNHALELFRPGRGIRWLIAAVDINYLAEAHYPGDVVIGHGIGRVGAKSWTVQSAAFQTSQCVATCDTTLVYTDADGPALIPDEFKTRFESFRVLAGSA